MTRFLRNLERDLEIGDLNLQRHQTVKRTKAVQSRPVSEDGAGDGR
jgi:hypothetical protein